MSATFAGLKRVILHLMVVGLAGVLLVGGSPAWASERGDVNTTGVGLAVNPGGVALVTYRARGRAFHTLVWGAVNARPPSQTVRQVHFRFDWSGGWGQRTGSSGNTSRTAAARTTGRRS